MVKSGAIPASAGASNSCLPSERLSVLSASGAYQHGIRSFPGTIEFHEVEPGGVYRRRFGVQNLRRSSVTVIFPNVIHTTKDHYLTYPYFSMEIDKGYNTISDVSPGLEKTATLTYTCDTMESHNDFAKIIIGEEFSIHIPITCCAVRPVLRAPSLLDFGELSSDGTPIGRRLTVENSGKRPANWKLEYAGEMPITFIPNNGLIQPGHKQRIQVELVPEIEGAFSETANFVGSGMDTVSVHIAGRIAKSALQLLEPAAAGDAAADVSGSRQLRLVDFGAVYYGSSHQRRVLLHNSGVGPVCFSIRWSPAEPGQEMAVDLSKSHLAAFAQDQKKEEEQVTGTCEPPEHCFHVNPALGRIDGKGHLLVTIGFSPRAYPPEKGFGCIYQAPPRRDYCLFLSVEPSVANSEHSLEFGRVCLGVKATSLPVVFNFQPHEAHFPQLRPGEKIQMPCQLINHSSVLPLKFMFSDIAHFRASVRKGVLKPGEVRNMHIVCKPTQIGPLWRFILLDLLGADSAPTTDGSSHQNLDKLLMAVRMRVSTYSAPITAEMKPLFVPGITPLWGNNETGLNTDKILPPCDGAPPCTLAAMRTNRHRWTRWATIGEQSYVAMPNDRAASIRPYTGPAPIRTICTGQPRYTYLDRRYQYTADEWRNILMNEAVYQRYINECKTQRGLLMLQRQRQLYKGQQNDKLLNRTATYLLGAEFSELYHEWSTVCSRERKRLLKLKACRAAAREPGLNKVEEIAEPLGTLEVVEGFEERPKSHRVRLACQRELTCVDLAKVKISDKLLNFGEVAQNVWACRTLEVRNYLDGPILFQLHVDCPELEQTNPTSAVVPARSLVRLPVIFTCDTKREYKRVIKYSINGTYRDSVLVVAAVVRMRLEISTSKLYFKCSNLTSVEPGIYQMVVVLYNSLNGVGEYLWRQERTDSGEYDPAVFSIKPAHGVIDPYHSQRCVVTFRPRRRPRQPYTATFACYVTGGDTLSLAVNADLGAPKLKLTEDRIQLENLPLYKVKKCTPRLFNVGSSDAFFSIMDPYPFPGVSVSPTDGCVPAGGSMELQVIVVPCNLLRFDAPVRIQVRDGGSIVLGISGRVEAPNITSDSGSLYFGGVYCGNSVSQIFHLENRSKIATVLEFDLREHKEFSLSGVLQSSQDSPVAEIGEHVFTVEVGDHQTVPVCCQYAPRSLANHGFVMEPLLHIPDEARTLSADRTAPQKTPSMTNRKRVQARRGQPQQPVAVVNLPSFKVIATALMHPVTLEPPTLQFRIGAKLLEKCYKVTKHVKIINNVSNAIKVVINARANDCFQVGLRGEDAPKCDIIDRQLEAGQTMKVPITFTTSFLYPTHPMVVRARLPIYVDQLDQPAVSVGIVADCSPTHLTTDPSTIFMGAVPLGMTLTSNLQVICHDYQKGDELEAKLSYMECYPRGQTPPEITWEFPAGNLVAADKPSQVIPVSVTFVSSKPACVSAQLLISDGSGRRTDVVILAGADNCLLTTYSFISAHPDGYQNWIGESMTPPVSVGSQENVNPGRRANQVMSTTSCDVLIADEPQSAAAMASSLKNGTEHPAKEGASIFSAGSRQVGIVQPPMDILRPTGSKTEFPRFPNTEGQVKEFYQATYDAVQNWFCEFGFPQGTFPYELYEYLPQCLAHRDESSGSLSQEDKAQAHMWQSVVHTVTYLSNKRIPDLNTADENEPDDDKEWVLRYIKRNRAVLNFLKHEGALLTHVRPEFLLRYEDFQILLGIVQEVQDSMDGSKLEMEVSQETIQAGISARNINHSNLISSRAASLNDVAQHLLDPNIILVYSAFRDKRQFMDMSKLAWMDVLLQLFRRFILQSVVKLPAAPHWPEMTQADVKYMPEEMDPVESNIYSVPERILLNWMTWCYNSQMRQLWDAEASDECTITNFDSDLDDGVVLCSLFAAHCPFLREGLRQDVFCRPSSPEQVFHNCVLVAETCTLLNLDLRLDPSALMDSNPVAMILLTTMLYEKLPFFWPRNVIHFRPELGSSQARQLSMKNPGPRPVTYEVKMLNATKGIFQVQGGPEISVGAHRTLEVTVRCTVPRIKQYTATLLLCPKCSVAPRPRPLVYPLAGGPLGTSAPVVVEVVSPLYSFREVPVEVPNPLKEEGDFTVLLTDKTQGDQDLDTWLRSGTDAFPVLSVGTVSLKARGRTLVTVAHSPWLARCRDYYALFSNERLGDFIVCLRSSPSDPLPFADVSPAHGWLSKISPSETGTTCAEPCPAPCSEPCRGDTCLPLVTKSVQDGERTVQVGCEECTQEELEAAVQFAGPFPKHVSAVWMLDVDQVACAHCHLVVDLNAKLRSLLQQCAQLWDGPQERERRQLNGTLVSSDMIHQFQLAKYVLTPKIQCASASKRVSSPPDAAQPPAGQAAYHVSCRNKEVDISPRLVNVDGSPGAKSIPLCLSFTGKSPGWVTADIVLRNHKFSDLITTRVAFLVRRAKPKS